MWSLGVILFILLSGTFPFDEDALFDQISSAQYSMAGIEWYNISKQAKDLIRQLMTLMPHERLTITQALHHEWILGHSSDSKITNPLVLLADNTDRNIAKCGSVRPIQKGLSRKSTKRKQLVGMRMNTMDKLFKEQPVLNLETSHTPQREDSTGPCRRPSIASIFRASSKLSTAAAIESSLRKSMIVAEEKENNVNRLVDFCTSYGFCDEISNMSVPESTIGDGNGMLPPVKKQRVKDKDKEFASMSEDVSGSNSISSIAKKFTQKTLDCFHKPSIVDNSSLNSSIDITKMSTLLKPASRKQNLKVRTKMKTIVEMFSVNK